MEQNRESRKKFLHLWSTDECDECPDNSTGRVFSAHHVEQFEIQMPKNKKPTTT